MQFIVRCQKDNIIKFMIDNGAYPLYLSVLVVGILFLLVYFSLKDIFIVKLFTLLAISFSFTFAAIGLGKDLEDFMLGFSGSSIFIWLGVNFIFDYITVIFTFRILRNALIF